MLVLLLYDFNNTMRVALLLILFDDWQISLSLSLHVLLGLEKKEYWYWANLLFNSASDYVAATTAVSDCFGIAWRQSI